MNSARTLIRVSILGAVVAAVLVFFAISVRTAPPPAPAAAESR